jgi:ATP-dependent DNA helicase DinG
MEPDDILRHGYLSLVKEVRPSQAELASDIFEMLLKGTRKTIYAEGGTGIGKSFAYLIPAILTSGAKVLISTAKKELQNQLVNKDLPFLIREMGLHEHVTYGAIKGKANYACFRVPISVIKNKRDQLLFDTWRKECTLHGVAAELTDWPGGERPQWWTEVSCENCVNTRTSPCPYRKICRPENAYPYNINVLNHSLLGAHMAHNPQFLIEAYDKQPDVLILDEAHNAPGMFRDSFTKTLNLAHLANQINAVYQDYDLDLDMHEVLGPEKFKDYKGTLVKQKDAVDRLRTLHAQYVKKAKDRQRLPPGLEKDLADYAANDTQPIFYAAELEQLLAIYALKLSDGTPYIDAGRLNARLHPLKRFNALLAHAEGFLTTLVQHVAKPDNTSSYVATTDNTGIYLQALDVGTLCGPHLAKIPYRVVLSATLAIGGNFDHIREQLGVDRTPESNTLCKHYSSPFNLEEQGLLYTPALLPPPEHDRNSEKYMPWVKAVAQEIASLIKITKGDAFVLFSKRDELNDVVLELQDHVDDSIPLLAQSETNSTQLLKTYMNTPHSVLLGLKTFWEGVDVQGEKLRQVIIVKLPFPNPSDPIIEALCAQAEQTGKNAFATVQIPHMIFDLKQAVGRLIRSKSDYGVVSILDPRVWTGSTKNHARVLKEIREWKAHLKTSPRLRTPANCARAEHRGYGKQIIASTGYKKVVYRLTDVENFLNLQVKASLNQGE